VTVEITVTQTPEQKVEERRKRQLAKVKATNEQEGSGRRPKLTKTQELEAEQRRQENRQRAVALELEDVPNALLTAEYPIGAANVVPHTHNYAGGLHLKIGVNGKVKRLNMVQDGVRYRSVPDTLEIAWQYDVENGTRIRKVLNALLDA
jgi:hypothetical protein